MKQFKAGSQFNNELTIDYLIIQHNALCNYLAEREENDKRFCACVPSSIDPKCKKHGYLAPKTITLPKPQSYEEDSIKYTYGFKDALEACSKASGITYKLED